LCARIIRLNYKIDINTLRQMDAQMLHANEVGSVEIELHAPIFCDSYDRGRTTGSFIVTHPLSNDTVAAGMIEQATPLPMNESVYNCALRIPSACKRGFTVWFTGLSGAGKTTVSRLVRTELLALGLQVEVIDGDVIRKYLCQDLGFSKEDRDENIRRIAFIAHLLTRNGIVVLVSAISPYRHARDAARLVIGEFVEVYVNAPLNVCEAKDPKEMYKKARLGKIRAFTGVDDPYEPPLHPEVVCETEHESTRESTAKVMEYIQRYLSS
jgi:adenylyl-sulfate kinase